MTYSLQELFNSKYIIRTYITLEELANYKKQLDSLEIEYMYSMNEEVWNRHKFYFRTKEDRTLAKMVVFEDNGLYDT